MFGTKSINRNNQMKIWELSPFVRKRPDGTCHHLHLDPKHGELRNNPGNLPVSNQRLSANYRNVQRSMPMYQQENSFDQFIPFPFSQTMDASPDA
jgi:hypothetical protein